MYKRHKRISFIVFTGLLLIFTDFLSGCVPIFGQGGASRHGSMDNWRVWWSDFALLFLLYIISRRKNTNRLEEKEALNHRDNATEVLKERNK